MTEVRRRVEKIQVDLKCPNCDNGYLKSNGNVLDSDPLLYEHQCNNENCRYRANLIVRYPYTEIELQTV